MSRTSSQERTEFALAAIPNRESFVATFVAMVGNRAQILHGVNLLEVRMSGQYAFIPGDPVRVEVAGADVVVAGPSIPKSATGKVAATGSPTIIVEYPAGSGITRTMPYATSYTPTLNDDVLINWDPAGGPVVVGKMSTVPSTAAPSLPTSNSSKTVHLPLLAARDSGSFQNGRWGTTYVYASDLRVGAWFYGTKINDSIPNGAAIVSARMYLPATSLSGYPPNLGYHDQSTKPAGTVTISSPAPLAGKRSGWVNIPTSLIDFLKANNGGLGLAHGGYNIYAGAADDGLSGALDITYRT